VVEHDVAPVGPHEFGLTSLRASAHQFGKCLAALCERAAAGGETRVGVLVDEYAIGGEDVGVIVAVAAAGINAVRITVDELRDLRIIQSRERTTLGSTVAQPASPNAAPISCNG
jgi:hypothetical protein